MCIVFQLSNHTCTPYGLCNCAHGWTECDGFGVGASCSPTLCSKKYTGSFCDEETSIMTRCESGLTIWQRTCPLGCDRANSTRCACVPACVNGYCSTDSTCKCLPGWYGESCEEGGLCERHRDGTFCLNSTHVISCIDEDQVGPVPCAGGSCSAECNCCIIDSTATAASRLRSASASQFVWLLFGVFLTCFVLSGLLCTRFPCPYFTVAHALRRWGPEPRPHSAGRHRASHQPRVAGRFVKMNFIELCASGRGTTGLAAWVNW